MSSCSIALLGLPNVGKSSLFNVLYGSQKAKSENYPFCTIEPNIALVPFYDNRLYELQKRFNSQKIIPSVVEIKDIAGLIEGAAEGEGLGNAFLSEIYSVDCIIYVVRCFTDEEILHVYDEINPIRDLEIIMSELKKKDLQMVQNWKDNKNFKTQRDDLVRIEKQILNNEKIVNNDRSIHLLSTKPFIILCNGSINEYTNVVIEKCEQNNWNYTVVDVKTMQENLNNNLSNQSVINNVVEKCRNSMKMISFFTAGEKEVHAWDIIEGTNIRNASGKIHTRFTEKFIRAKILPYKNAIDATQKIQMQTVDGNYIVQDGIIVEVLHN